MRIAVCIKQVPEREDCSIDREQGVMIRKGSMRMNPWDRFALETALRLKGEKGSAAVFTMGPPSAGEVLREAIAMGVDEGILVSDSAFAGADVYATSYTLAGAIRLHRRFDAIVCGKQTADGNTAQVGAALAAQLGWEYLGDVKSMNFSEKGRVRVKQAGSMGIYETETEFPFVMAVEQDIFIPRIPTLKMRLLAGKRDISLIKLADMKDSCPEHYGLRGSPTHVIKTYRPKAEKRGTVKLMNGEEGAAALRLIIKERIKKGETNGKLKD